MFHSRFSTSQSAWKFFFDRIPYEEAYLIDFFGIAYVEYARGTIIGIPFVKPYEALVGYGEQSALSRTSSTQPAPRMHASLDSQSQARDYMAKDTPFGMPSM